MVQPWQTGNCPGIDWGVKHQNKMNNIHVVIDWDIKYKNKTKYIHVVELVEFVSFTWIGMDNMKMI